MPRKTKEEIMSAVKRAKEHVESLGYEVAHISLYGSQNYGLDTDDSDMDFKCIVIPTLEQLVKNQQPVSTTYDFEGGKIDMKDIRVFMETLSKCNPAYLEVMYSDYCITPCAEFEEIKALTPRLITERAALFARACHGMAMEKFNALTHPYPSTQEKIDKFGYDPKQLHHIIRLYCIMYDFKYFYDYRMVQENEIIRTILLNAKKGLLSLDTARHSAKTHMDALIERRNEIEKSYPEIKSEAKNEMMKLSQDVIYNSIIRKIYHGVQVIR